MTNDLSIFEGTRALVSDSLRKELLDATRALAAGGGTLKRLSIRGGRWRMMHGKEQVAVNKSDTLNVIIVNASKLSRTYFEGTYDPDDPQPPVCWSHDTITPAPEVPAETRQASKCADCPMAVKGSGAGNSAACRFSQRLAVLLEGRLDEVYQLQIPATSIFGEAKKGLMGLKAYAGFMAAHDTPIIAVVTEMKFDDDSEVPKLFFRAVRALVEDEFEAAITAKDSAEALAAITMTVSQGEGRAPKASAPPAAPAKKAAKVAPPVQDDEEEDAPPAKKTKPRVQEEEDEDVTPPARKTKPAAASPSKPDLAAIVSDWDDE